MSKILWEDLEDGKKIKVLDSIYSIDEGSINLDEEGDVYITGNQIENKLLIAEAGDIGTWNKEDSMLYFDIENEDDGEVNIIQHGIDFGGNCSCGLEVDSDIFEVIN